MLEPDLCNFRGGMCFDDRFGRRGMPLMLIRIDEFSRPPSPSPQARTRRRDGARSAQRNGNRHLWLSLASRSWTSTGSRANAGEHADVQ